MTESLIPQIKGCHRGRKILESIRSVQSNNQCLSVVHFSEYLFMFGDKIIDGKTLDYFSSG